MKVKKPDVTLSEKARARIGLIDERLARLRAQRERVVTRTNRVERKRDTRRKITAALCAAILARCRSNASVHQRRPIIAPPAVWCNAS